MSNNTQTELLSKTDELISMIHSSIVTEENTEDIKSLISELQNECLIDKVLYGNEFEMIEKKYNEIEDVRVNHESIKIENFLKPQFKLNKETKVYTEVKPIPCVRILSGYHDEYEVSEYDFFANLYDGDDKEAFKTSISDKNQSDKQLKESREKLLVAIQSEVKKDITEATKKATEELKLNVKYVHDYNELMTRVPHVAKFLDEKSKDTTANLRLQHSRFQDVCKNRISVLRTALKHSEVIQSSKELEELKTRNLKLSTLWNRLQPDHKRLDMSTDE